MGMCGSTPNTPAHVKGGHTFSIEDIPDLNGKVFVVTGASEGIGLKTSKALAAKVHITLLK
jgi:hypothetical protein